MPDSEARSAFPKILKAYMEKHGYNQSDIAPSLYVLEPYPVIVFKIEI